MNHELTGSTLSEPVVGDPLNRGAYVSKLVLDSQGNVLSGERAYDWVFDENTFVGPAAAVGRDPCVLALLLRLARRPGGRVRPADLPHE